MTTKQKIRLLRIDRQERELIGCQNLMGDSGRSLKAEIYADVLRRHPNALTSGRFYRVVRAVNNLIAV